MNIDQTTDTYRIELVRNHLQAKLCNFPTSMVREIFKVVETICFGSYRDEIALLPFHVFTALGQINDAASVEIGTAQCLGWSAYYFLDQVADGQRDNLAIGIALHRLTVLSYEEIFKDLGKSMVEKMLTRMDTANYFEEINAAPFSSLVFADKSIGHALGVISPIMIAGHDMQSTAVRQALYMMRHLIAARQLADDLHDWADDYAAGHETSVTACLFEKNYEADKQATLLLQSMCRTCKKLLYHAEIAAKSARENAIFLDPSFFIKRLEKLSQPAREFIRAYDK
ncbi:MAG: hypothetical protein KGJ35_02455 [Patescibacteria group bacterium]|nr:hypothetical protein [Patescibacteria group bacterium]